MRNTNQNKDGTQANIDALSPITQDESASRISPEIIFDEEFLCLSDELLRKNRKANLRLWPLLLLVQCME